jgi:hypothetical protein
MLKGPSRACGPPEKQRLLDTLRADPTYCPDACIGIDDHSGVLTRLTCAMAIVLFFDQAASSRQQVVDNLLVQESTEGKVKGTAVSVGISHSDHKRMCQPT